MGNQPLRVLHVVGGLGPGGIESFLMSVYRQIDRTKVQFDFMVPEDVEYHYSQEVRDLGGRIYVVPYGKKDYFASNRRLREFYKEKGYQVVHLHDGHLHSMQPLEQAKEVGVPVRVLHAHCARGEVKTTRDLVDAVVHEINKRRIMCATHFFACSRDAADYFGFEERGDQTRWRTILNGINVEKFSYSLIERRVKRDELGLEEKDFLIGNVGRLENQKNQALLVRAMPQIRKKIPSAKLLIVGDGTLKPDLLRLAESLSVQDDCIFLSNRRDVAELCDAMDVFAFPSIYEGLGIALVEAEANGLPCVVSPGVPEEALATKNCEICGIDNGGDPNEWADAIVRAASKGRLEEAPTQVEAAGFSVKRTAQQLEDFYLTSIERQ